MSNILNPMTAQTPSAFGTPMSGHAFGSTSVRVLGIGSGTGIGTSVVRDRKAVIGAGSGADTGLAQGYFAGTSAWRPPNC